MRLITSYGIAFAIMAALPLHPARAQSVDEAEREQVAANFREADADGDGALTRAEFTRLIDLNAQDGIGRAKLIASLDGYDLAFGRADANADGRVTPEEISAIATQGR